MSGYLTKPPKDSLHFHYHSHLSSSSSNCHSVPTGQQFQTFDRMPTSTRQQWSTRSGNSSSSGCSDAFSSHSASTAPTIHSTRPSTQPYAVEGEPDEKSTWDKPDYSDPRASIDTYASTNPSIEDLRDEPPPFEVPDDDAGIAYPTAFPSTPQEFADYFPSTQRLSIKHDDATLDGNMNLRIDTEAQTSDGGKVDLTLFHLRMHDLKRREFSLRRYCRDSGREICHSSRKYSKPSLMRRPGLQRSMSNALSNLRSKSETKTSTTSSLRGHGSAEDSVSDEDWDSNVSPPSTRQPSNMSIPTNITQLEFSNYAHLDVKRRGTKASKRYEFEYWGAKYVWKRVALKSGSFMEISYHLINVDTSASIAHIVPVPLSTSEAREEDARGGYVFISIGQQL